MTRVLTAAVLLLLFIAGLFFLPGLWWAVALFPLMPPRLVNTPPSESRFGGGQLALDQDLPNYGFVDTLRDGKGVWSFDSQGMDNISNQYAAMPSLHIGWSLWCMLVLWRFSRRLISRLLALAYPVVTLIAIVATANHFIIDAAGGIAIVIVGSLVAHVVERVQRSRGAAAFSADPTSSSDVLVGN